MLQNLHLHHHLLQYISEIPYIQLVKGEGKDPLCSTLASFLIHCLLQSMPILGNYNVCVFSLLGMIGFLWYMHFEKLVVHLLDSLKRVCVFSVFKDIITYMVSLLGYIYTLYVY